MSNREIKTESDPYLHFEKGSGISPYLAAHFARQNHNGNGPNFPIEYINWHEAVEFLHVLHGEIHILCGEQLIHAHAGDTVSVDPFVLHGTLLPSPDADLFYIKICPEFYRECEIPFDGISHERLIHDDEENDLFRKLAEMNEKRDTPYFLPRFKAYLLLLVTHLRTHHALPYREASVPQKKILAPVIPAIEYIHAHFTEKLSVSKIAEVAHISESHLSHSFRTATGMSVLQYINHLRFLYAKTLFATTRLSVGEVASACGFRSFSYFSREYAKRMGVSPSQEGKGEKSEP